MRCGGHVSLAGWPRSSWGAALVRRCLFAAPHLCAAQLTCATTAIPVTIVRRNDPGDDSEEESAAEQAYRPANQTMLAARDDAVLPELIDPGVQDGHGGVGEKPAQLGRRFKGGHVAEEGHRSNPPGRTRHAWVYGGLFRRFGRTAGRLPLRLSRRTSGWGGGSRRKGFSSSSGARLPARSSSGSC